MNSVVLFRRVGRNKQKEKDGRWVEDVMEDVQDDRHLQIFPGPDLRGGQGARAGASHQILHIFYLPVLHF